MRRWNTKAAWPILLFIIFSMVSDGTAAWGTAVSLNADARQLKGREFGVTVSVDAVYDAFGIACDLVYDPFYNFIFNGALGLYKNARSLITKGKIIDSLEE